MPHVKGDGLVPRLFGTDGVRGVANRDLTPDLVLALGRAAGEVIAPEGGLLVVGRDTRVSGPMLEGALVAGLCSAGASVKRAGIVPSPAVSYLVLDQGASGGAVISASHNPVEDNGIKFFGPRGEKISAEIETEIERHMEVDPDYLPAGMDVGRAEDLDDSIRQYVDYLTSTVDDDLRGLKVVLDCAFGAAWDAAPRAFAAASADVIAMNAEPDGTRINVDCGSTSLDGLAKRVVDEEADIGFAFDGDADRVLAVDETGGVVDGDGIIGMNALRLRERGELQNDLVVGTLMSNLGLRRALEGHGIEFVAAPVGDRHVADTMSDRGAVLGGEQSGHVIFARLAPTGDGVLTALQVAGAVRASRRPLSELAHLFEPYPQVLINVKVAERGGLETAEEIWEQVRRAEQDLGAEGRVLVRASGTEPVVRVMVEASDRDRATATAESLAAAVRERLG
jgi:phosphoglucosamine mutase